jgi:hypothetical protein
MKHEESDHLGQNDDYLDERIKRVSARQPRASKWAMNEDGLCCRSMFVAKLIAQKLLPGLLSL